MGLLSNKFITEISGHTNSRQRQTLLNINTDYVFLSLSEGLRNIAMDSNSLAMPMSDPNAWATAMNNLGMAPMSMTGQPIMPGNSLYSTMAFQAFN